MAKRNVRFTAFKTVTKPATVEFRTKSGKRAPFKALKTVKQGKTVHFRARRSR